MSGASPRPVEALALGGTKTHGTLVNLALERIGRRCIFDRIGLTFPTRLKVLQTR